MRTAKPTPLRFVPLALPGGFYSHEVRKMEEEKKKNKGGRPAKKLKRDSKMGFNATLVERTVIQAKAKQSGLKAADYLRDLALRGKLRQVPTAEELQLFRDLSGVANNLNQLTKEAHQQNLSALVPKVLRTLDEIHHLIKHLDHKD